MAAAGAMALAGSAPRWLRELAGTQRAAPVASIIPASAIAPAARLVVLVAFIAFIAFIIEELSARSMSSLLERYRGIMRIATRSRFARIRVGRAPAPALFSSGFAEFRRLEGQARGAAPTRPPGTDGRHGGLPLQGPAVVLSTSTPPAVPSRRAWPRRGTLRRSRVAAARPSC